MFIDPCAILMVLMIHYLISVKRAPVWKAIVSRGFIQPNPSNVFAKKEEEKNNTKPKNVSFISPLWS